MNHIKYIQSVLDHIAKVGKMVFDMRPRRSHPGIKLILAQVSDLPWARFQPVIRLHQKIKFKDLTEAY